MPASQHDSPYGPEEKSAQRLDETHALSGETTGSAGGSGPGMSDPTEWIGMLVDRYEIIRVLGVGGMGMVFEALDTMIERHVALKILSGELVEEQVARRRFLDEARAVGKLNHSHVVVLYEIGEQENVNYIVMELMAGGSAGDGLERQQGYTAADATRMARQAAAGLAAAHAAGIVHRDMKPANLLLNEQGMVKVTDFGLAKQLTDPALGVTREGQLIGTPSFMSPEQCESNAVDFHTDIYSLGATYYALLTGERPFADQTTVVSVMYAHCHAAPPDPRELAAKIPAAAAEIVLRAMAKQPADRYESMEAMESALWQLELQQTGGVTALGRLTDTRSRRFLIVLMGGLILLALIGIGQFFSGGWSDRGGTFLPQGEPIRVGVLHSLSGTMADSERPVVHAVLLAIEELNNAGGVLGRPVEAIVADGKSRADVFAAEAERLINQQQVVTVFGCWTSESRKTIVPLFEEADHLLIYPVQYEGLEESPNVFYLGAAPNQQILPAIDWLHRVLEARKFMIVGSDYVFPRVASEIIKDRLQELGGELVGEVYLPLGSRNVDLAVETIEQTQPDVILNLINGSTNVALFSELRKRGIMPDKIPAISFSVGEAELARMDATAMVGDYAAWNYFQSIDSAENKEFVRKFRAKYGPHQVVTDPMETAYAGVKLWAAAVEDADSTAPGAIRRALKNMRGHAPGGPVRIDPGTQHAFKRPRIGRVVADGQFEIVWEAEKPLRPEPYPDSRSAAEWRAVLHDLYRDWGNRWSPPWEAGRPAAGKK